MKVSKERWQQAMHNLITRRAYPGRVGNAAYNPIADYAKHLSKIEIGRRVLDVGCGSKTIEGLLPAGHEYVGIDAFPVNDSVLKMEIEECTFEDKSFDTVFCFAVLDGVHDMVRALEQMKRVCRKNIYFLTGVNIDPDIYHTIKISQEELVYLMNPFRVGYFEYLSPKVLLVEFRL